MNQDQLRSLQQPMKDAYKVLITLRAQGSLLDACCALIPSEHSRE
jgi:hypothetical protein